MATERFVGNEEIHARAEDILRAKSLIKKSIFAGVPASSFISYSQLEMLANRGADTSDESFVAEEGLKIELAFPVLSAELQKAFVERTMIKMLSLNREFPHDTHVIELFPLAELDDGVQKGPSAVDILKRWPEKFEEVAYGAAEQARQKVVTSIVELDKLVKIGLHRFELYLPIFAGGYDIIALPTVIHGVHLRQRTIKEELLENEVLEVVMEAL